MSDTGTTAATLPSEAVFGRLDPNGPGPTMAEVFESWDVDEDNPVELIGGWVLPMAPGDFETGDTWGDLDLVLRLCVKARGWRISLDARHRLPKPRNTVVFPDIAIHAAGEVAYLPGTKSIGRVPDLVVEILAKKTFERDMAPSGAKFLAYQMSGVREYYYTWPDGKDAAGFVLQDGVYKPLARDSEGFFQSPLLAQALRLVPAMLRPA